MAAKAHQEVAGFDLLVECQPRGACAGALRGGVASFALHSALIAGAVIATMQTVARPHDLDWMVPVVFQDPPDRDVPPPLPGVIRVLSTDHPLFGAPAMQVVAASVYQPGRMYGRAVRVRVQVPIDFQVTTRGLRMTPNP